MKIQVGKKYVSGTVGIVDCIAEREGIFIVENDEYCYHVNQSGVALYIDNDKWCRLTDNEFDLQCEVGFGSEDDFDVAKVLHNFLETENGKEFMNNLKPEVKPKETKHEHYFKNVSQLDKIDVYAVLRLFEVTDPCIQHAVKKLLCTGKRGHKDFQKDIQDSIDSLVRCQELHNELNPELNQGNQDA